MDSWNQRISNLLLLLGVLALNGCATSRQPGTPMKSNCSATISMPTVEECQEAAKVISNEALRECVREQCGDISLVCDEETRKVCKESKARGQDVLAYVVRLESTSLSSRVKKPIGVRSQPLSNVSSRLWFMNWPTLVAGAIKMVEVFLGTRLQV